MGLQLNFEEKFPKLQEPRLNSGDSGTGEKTMRYLKFIITTMSVVFFVARIGECQNQKRLLNQEDLKYIGAFRLPQGHIGCNNNSDYCTFEYGGTPIAVDPDGNNGKGSLFIGSHTYSQKLAEVAIPNLVVSDNLNDLNTTSILQGFNDITEGNRKKISENGVEYSETVITGGLMLYGDRLIGSVYVYYGGSQPLSHYVSSKNLSQIGDFSGMHKIETEVGSRYFAGYMDVIPLEWQEKLNGKAITGLGGVSIHSTSSVGPTAFSFDPSNLGKVIPTKATALMYYPLTTPLGAPESSDPMYNANATVRGVAFPEGYDSVLFFGAIGLGDYCYGIGTSNESLVGQLKPGSTTERYACYDPGSEGKGPHAYPYTYRVWAYDANDFVKVRNGVLKPWQVRPYKTWDFDLPFQPLRGEILGTAYDKKNRKLYISQDQGDKRYPLVHVLEFPNPAGPEPPVLNK